MIDGERQKDRHRKWQRHGVESFSATQVGGGLPCGPPHNGGQRDQGNQPQTSHQLQGRATRAQGGTKSAKKLQATHSAHNTQCTCHHSPRTTDVESSASMVSFIRWAWSTTALPNFVTFLRTPPTVLPSVGSGTPWASYRTLGLAPWTPPWPRPPGGTHKKERQRPKYNTTPGGGTDKAGSRGKRRWHKQERDAGPGTRRGSSPSSGAATSPPAPMPAPAPSPSPPGTPPMAPSVSSSWRPPVVGGTWAARTEKSRRCMGASPPKASGLSSPPTAHMGQTSTQHTHQSTTFAAKELSMHTREQASIQ